MKTVALIPARAGSRGLPGKNVRDFLGKPLMAWAIEVGLETCDQTFVSTENDWIAKRAKQCGAKVIKRRRGLAQDKTPMLAVVQHALEELPIIAPDVVVLLQPTQPLRTAEHVRRALDMLKDESLDSVVSVVEVPAHFSPDYVMRIEEGQLLPWSNGNLIRRQDARTVYSRDGTVYAVRSEVVKAGSLYGKKCAPMLMHGMESCNIDDAEDWCRAERMMRERPDG
jgi:CMP-N-acetylneuraminic acid synthetase